MVVVNGIPCTTPSGLAAALASDGDASRDLLWDGGWAALLARWVEETGDTAVWSISSSLEGRPPDYRVARLISFLDPFRPPDHRGRPLDVTSLAEMAARSAHEGPPIALGPWATVLAPAAEPSDAEVLRALERDGLLGAWAGSDGFAPMAIVDESWRAELAIVRDTPLALSGRDRPSATFARGLLLLAALNLLEDVCPVCGQEAGAPDTTCRLVQAMVAIQSRPAGMGPGAALVLWGAARQRQDLTRRAEQLDGELALARTDNEPAAARSRIGLERTRMWVWWGVVSAIVLAALGFGGGRRGAVIAAICVVGLAGLLRWWLDVYLPQVASPEAPEAPEPVVDLTAFEGPVVEPAPMPAPTASSN